MNLFSKKTPTRTYGHDQTIHQTGHVDVEVDKRGNVVAVWFRCQPLPFRQSNVDDRRSGDMDAMYSTAPGVEENLVAVTLAEHER